MAKQVINIGTNSNDGTGDSIRDAFDKTNDNFTELYAEPAIVLVCGGVEANIAQKTGVVFFRLPKNRSFTLTALPIAVMKVAPTDSAAQFDIKDDGTTIFSTVLSIDDGEYTSEDSAAPCVLTSTPYTFAAGSVITVDITQIGSTVAGQEPIVTLYGYYTIV